MNDTLVLCTVVWLLQNVYAQSSFNMLPAQQCDSSCSLQYNEGLICHHCGVYTVRSVLSMIFMRTCKSLNLCQTLVGESEILGM